VRVGGHEVRVVLIDCQAAVAGSDRLDIDEQQHARSLKRLRATHRRDLDQANAVCVR